MYMCMSGQEPSRNPEAWVVQGGLDASPKKTLSVLGHRTVYRAATRFQCRFRTNSVHDIF